MLGIKGKVKEFDTNAVAEKALDLFSGAKEQLKKGITTSMTLAALDILNVKSYLRKLSW